MSGSLPAMRSSIERFTSEDKPMSKTLCKVLIHLRSGHRRVARADADTHERALAFSYPPERAPVFFVRGAATVNSSPTPLANNE